MLRLVRGFLPWIILAALGRRWFVPALGLALAVAAATTIRQLSRLLSALVSLYQERSGDSSFVVRYAWIFFAVGAVLFTVNFPGWYRTHMVRTTTRNLPPSGE